MKALFALLLMANAAWSQTVLDYVPPKATDTLSRPHGTLRYARSETRIYITNLRQTEPGGQVKLVKELLTIARVPVMAVVSTPAQIKFYTARGFLPVSRSNELAYTVMTKE